MVTTKYETEPGLWANMKHGDWKGTRFISKDGTDRKPGLELNIKTNWLKAWYVWRDNLKFK